MGALLVSLAVDVCKNKKAWTGQNCSAPWLGFDRSKLTPARLQPKFNHNSLAGNPSWGAVGLKNYSDCWWQRRIENSYHHVTVKNRFTLHQRVLPASQPTLINRLLHWKCHCPAPVSNIWLDSCFLYWQKLTMLNIWKIKMYYVSSVLLFAGLVSSKWSLWSLYARDEEPGNSLRDNSVTGQSTY